MSKVYVFFATGYEEIEGLTTVDLLRRAGIDVATVSITGDKTVLGSHNIPVVMDCLFEEVCFGDADMLVLPGGGAGTKGLEAFEPLMLRVDEFIEKDKAVAAICAAPSILGHRGHLAGKKATCYPGFEKELTGATFVAQPAVRDGKIITGRGMGASTEFGLAVVAFFRGEASARQLGDKIMFCRDFM